MEKIINERYEKELFSLLKMRKENEHKRQIAFDIIRECNNDNKVFCENCENKFMCDRQTGFEKSSRISADINFKIASLVSIIFEEELKGQI